MTDERESAFHEAGHAVAAVLLGIPIDGASIESLADLDDFATGDHPFYGFDLRNLPPDGVEIAERFIVVYLAGFAAQCVVASKRDEALKGAADDFELANAVAQVLSEQSRLSADRDEHMKRGMKRAVHLADVCDEMIEAATPCGLNFALPGSIRRRRRRRHRPRGIRRRGSS